MSKWRLRFFVGLGACLSLLLLGADAALASAEEACFTAKINAARSTPLATDGALVSMARRHSQRMASEGRIFHNSNLSAEAPAGWRSLGENVGMGPSCDSVHNAFMNSSAHRANIQDPDFNFVGVGVVIAGDGTIFVTEVFMQKEASQPAQNAPAPTKPPPAPKVAKPKAAPRPAPAPAPAPAPEPPPPPPPPPEERVKGQTRAYIDMGALSEPMPSEDQQAIYDRLLEDKARKATEAKQMAARTREREHSLYSRIAALIAGAFSATV